MNLVGRISRSLDRSTPKGRAARRITWVCSAVCFAVMTAAVSIQRGFEESIAQRIGVLGGDLALERGAWGDGEPDSVSTEAFRAIGGLEQAMAIGEQAAVVQAAGGTIRGALLRRAQGGLEWLDGLWIHRPSEAEWRQDEGQAVPLAVSHTLARRLGLEVGSRVDLLSFDDSPVPYKTEGRVAGIYSTAIETAEEPLVFAPWDGTLTGYLLRGRSIDREAAEELAAENGWSGSSAEERAPELFDWLAMLRGNMVLVVAVILVVGLVNLAGSVLIFILEGTRTIALLGALGLPQRKIRRMFLRRSLSVVGQGALWGVGIGAGLAAAQHYGKIIELNPADYFVDALPMAIVPWEWCLLSVVALGAIGLSVWGTTYVLGRIRPAEALTYE